MEAWALLFTPVAVVAGLALLWRYLRRRRTLEHSKAPALPVSGGSLIAETLQAHGVRQLFTLCGGHISPILVNAKKCGIKVVDVRHEATAVFAADATSRLTTVPGVAVVTAGPGLTNTVTAVKNAQCAQTPLVLLTGTAPTILRGRGALQDIDQRELLAPHCKQFYACNKVSDLSRSVQEAFQTACAMVPGPVCIECPIDVLYEEPLVRDQYLKRQHARTLTERLLQWYLQRHVSRMHSGRGAARVGLPLPYPVPVAAPAEIENVHRLLVSARRPLFIVGSQTALVSSTAAGLSRERPVEAARAHMREVGAALQGIGAPCYCAGLARGLLGPSAAVQLLHRRRDALREADVVVLLGMPADFRLDYGRGVPRAAALVAVNRCRADLRRGLRAADRAVHGDPAAFAVGLYARVQRGPLQVSGEWWEVLRQRDAARDAQIAQDAAMEAYDRVHQRPAINPLALLRALQQHLPPNTILVGDGGDFVAACSYVVRPRAPLSWLDPGVFGTLGVGAGFALAAATVCPDRQVWIIWGDGSSGYSIAEYDTFVRHRLPVIGLIGNNASWAQIARDQAVVLGDDVACQLAFSRYHAVAEGFGALGVYIGRPEEVPDALDRAALAAAQGDPVCINAIIGASGFRNGAISM